MTLLVLFFLLSISFSFLCSIWEAVILSVTPKFIKKQLVQGTKLGKDLNELKQDIDKPLSAILTLNTIAHTVGAIGVGAQAGAVFGETNLDFGLFTLTGESLVATVMTLAILVLSEIIPKTIGANMWKELAPFTVNSLKVLLFILTPFVWLSQRITKTLKKEKEKSVLSRSDFQEMTSEGLQSGALDQKESNIINNLLRLNKLKVEDIMTPRSVLFAVDERTPIKQFYEEYKDTQFSRIPLFSEKTDIITGYILKDALLIAVADQNDTGNLADLKRSITFIENEYSVTDLFNLLIPKREHIAIVNDQYGSVIGIVTMEDVFETLLGFEIMDESDKIVDMQKHARSLWKKRAKEKNNELD